ncbi:unnamed protein product [Prunus armeniaca]|uniref:Uncharacterized protein n=1 Tax=Prunus armeniaca TaxID=36596 RepID=A0A6J5TXL5_PRUAR|nr:unnamed protein product [Prunus armeniaca]
MTYNTESTGALYEVKFKYGGEVDDMGGGAALEPLVKFSRFNTAARIFNRSQLYALFDGRQSSDVVAFHPGKENWNKVEVDTHDYTSFRGRAVVVGETIYTMNLFDVDVPRVSNNYA